jgi:uncharacterized protein (DUF697 family)
MPKPLSFLSVRGLMKELESSSHADTWLALGGARELVDVLRRELLAGGGNPAAVRVGGPEGAAGYVHVVAGSEDDEAALTRAFRARVPIVAVVSSAGTAPASLPFVLATDVVRVPPGAGFPIQEIARVIAARLGEAAAPLAARLPVLRPAVTERLIASFSRRNGLVGAAVFVPGADLPILTLNQLRLVLRLAQAYGQDAGRERLPELALSVGAGFGFRAIARELLQFVPFAGWAVKAGVAYTGTRALGEAAMRRFELDASETATPRPASTSRAEP